MTEKQIEDYLMKLENELLNKSEKNRLNFLEIGLIPFQTNQHVTYFSKMEKFATWEKL